jgi:hypothetical protein
MNELLGKFVYLYLVVSFGAIMYCIMDITERRKRNGKAKK